jgi:hypothetical protein
MKEIFWNIRGLGKKGRMQYISEVIKNNDLSFLGL